MADAAHALRDARLRLLAFGMLAATLMLSLAVSFVVTPEDIESGRVVLSPACPSKRFLGVECLSCGMTRAFAALGHGRFGDALDYNRGAPVVWLVFLVGAAFSLRSALRAARELRHLRQTLPSSHAANS